MSVEASEEDSKIFIAEEDKKKKLWDISYEKPPSLFPSAISELDEEKAQPKVTNMTSFFSPLSMNYSVASVSKCDTLCSKIDGCKREDKMNVMCKTKLKQKRKKKYTMEQDQMKVK